MIDVKKMSKIALIGELRECECVLKGTAPVNLWGPHRPNIAEITARRFALRNELVDRGYMP